MKIRRRLLAWFILIGKKPTRKNVLKLALKYYLKGYSYGLCVSLSYAKDYYGNTNDDLNISEYNRNNAVKYFNGKLDGNYWWPLDDWKSRYKFMKWLISIY